MTTPKHSRVRSFAPLSALAFALALPAAAHASTTFGTLSNFDVFNDTGEDCHGFEIELDGLSSSDVVYKFGAPYERYGDPVVVDFAGGVYVRYMSEYDAVAGTFKQATPMAPTPILPTAGHECWTGGSVNYPTSGCEHFGVSLNGNPTKTVYRWLVADPLIPGSLKPSGTNVNIPAPVWNVSPPPPNVPDQVHPVVAAVIEPPDPQNFDFGDALWMKVYVTEGPDPADLDNLLSGNPAVPQDAAEVEMEWELIQAEKGVPHSSEHGAQIKEGNESVTRRYEFYEYTGSYDPENHEAQPVTDSAPSAGELGNYIGAQMAAANVGILVNPMCGDSDNDKKITIRDALAALRAAVQLPSPCDLAHCDVDHNGSIGISDALHILRAAVGIPIVLAC